MSDNTLMNYTTLEAPTQNNSGIPLFLQKRKARSITEGMGLISKLSIINSATSLNEMYCENNSLEDKQNICSATRNNSYKESMLMDKELNNQLDFKKTKKPHLRITSSSEITTTMCTYPYISTKSKSNYPFDSKNTTILDEMYSYKNNNYAPSNATETNNNDNINGIDSLYPAQITEDLYLGNEYQARNVSLLKKLNIKYVLNLAKEVQGPMSHMENSEIRYKHHRWDHAEDDISNFFESCFEFIDEAISSNCNVLVHCQLGVSRSATLVIAYIMHSKKLTFSKAYDYVKSRNPKTCPNLSLIAQLMEYEKTLNLTYSTPAFVNTLQEQFN
ncbi:hypothetical protein BB558_007632 [Smittium angustum]|uniref:protein-tyrosine-phosphatase n=1 Tax=Smittium angustum TaxID=133377 RepID=A0A2U1IUJ8_SMIAN|nr:hypothetical protein BB558_007632 [Smittium angustum]